MLGSKGYGQACFTEQAHAVDICMNSGKGQAPSIGAQALLLEGCGAIRANRSAGDSEPQFLLQVNGSEAQILGKT